MGFDLWRISCGGTAPILRVFTQRLLDAAQVDILQDLGEGNRGEDTVYTGVGAILIWNPTGHILGHRNACCLTHSALACACLAQSPCCFALFPPRATALGAI